MIPEEEIRQIYEKRFNTVLVSLAERLEDYIYEIVKEYPRIDRISARAKSISSFMGKAIKLVNGEPKYSDPINEIQDQIGVRIVSFYISDMENVCKLVEEYFGPIEKQRKQPETDKEFGYEGYHYILFIPQDVLTPDFPIIDCPQFFELQIKTLFQHAWAQADHDLAYKSSSELTREHHRKVAFTAAQAWGADHIFNELIKELAN
jgi:ppGpp synthetase/RelA/SpoT-type nucleotidyltranferase